MENKRYHSPIHILVISPYFLPTIGGSQRYIEELYVHLVRQHPHVKVDVLAYNTEHVLSKETHRGLTIHRIPCLEIIKGQFALPNIFSLIGILIVLAKKRVDFVHTHIRFFDATWWAWIYAKLIGAKSIFTEQVASHPVYPHPFVAWVAKTVDMTIARWSIQKYSLITTTNNAAKKFLTKTLQIHKPITVSYGGVDTTFFSSGTSSTIPHIPKKLPKKALVLTYASRLIWSKGITYFLKAIENIGKLPNTVYIMIAGEGPLAPWVQQTIMASKHKNRIHFLGGLDYQNMRTLLKRTDIFVHPSHHNEGFPNVILEALSAQCFVIATDNAGTKEMLRSGTTGMIIKQKSILSIQNAIQYALLHKKSCTHIRLNARKDMKKRFDWNPISTSFYRLLQTLYVTHNTLLVKPSLSSV